VGVGVGVRGSVAAEHSFPHRSRIDLSRTGAGGAWFPSAVVIFYKQERIQHELLL